MSEAYEVRAVAGVIRQRYAGRSIELRVPPYVAIQLRTLTGAGPRHTRGTPPNVVETDAQTFLALVNHTTTWDDAFAAGRISVSGAHARDVEQMLTTAADSSAVPTQ